MSHWIFYDDHNRFSDPKTPKSRSLIKKDFWILADFFKYVTKRLEREAKVEITSNNHISVQYSTVQYSTVQYSTVQYSTVQYSTVQYSTVFML